MNTAASHSKIKSTEAIELTDAEVAALLTADAGKTPDGFLGAEIARLRSGGPEPYRHAYRIADDEPAMCPDASWPH